MAENFEAAIYTDCAAGQGLDGIAGMQFQAGTPRLTADLRAVIKRHLLYEPPSQLLEDGRPVAEFPLSLAHVCADGMFATASGRYLGREAKGARGGNHLTHAIATRDPTTYGIIRPAQLAGAGFWRAGPFPTTAATSPPDDWQPGPITPQAAASYVIDSPGGPRMLGGLVSVLATPRLGGHRRVAVVTDDALAALHLLAAATLLLPQRRALEIGFKVFAMEPARSALPVVVVHPSWSDFAADVDRDQGYAVFDLVHGRWTRTPADAEADAWADLFCTADPDLVGEAVDLADASGLRGVPARAMATAATLDIVPPPDVMPHLLRWLRGQEFREVREAYGESVVRALTAAPDPALLFDLMRVAEADYPSQRDAVAEALLVAEVRAAAAAAPGGGAVTRARWRVPGHQQPTARRVVVEALRTAEPAAFAAILTLAAARDVTVRLDQVAEAADRFVAGWLHDPEAPYQPSSWRTEPSLVPRLEEAIVGRARQEPMMRVLAATWWKVLRPRPFVADLDKPFDRALLSAAMRDGGAELRTALVRANVVEAKRRHRGGDRDAYRRLAETLWDEVSPPTLDELRLVGDHVGPELRLEPRFAAEIARALESRPLSATTLTDWRRVVRVFFDADDDQVREANRRVEDLEAQDRRFHEMLRRPFDDRHPTAAAVESSIGLIRDRRGAFVERLHGLQNPARLRDLLDVLPPDLVDGFLQRCAQDGRAGAWSPPRAAVMFFLLSRYRPERHPAGRVLHAACGPRLDAWAARSMGTQLYEVMLCLQPLGQPVADDWRRYADQWSRPPNALTSHLNWLRDTTT
ncbi:GTPase-associated protein 1-related protein [Jidongwangia harbinensis]|uniref:GTPase-associated protein 1-related protein n=1 Tax=Jidongwangia harbinensis TaxID=2878561 RepID=UPI001CDA49B2|nr:hypothetical protein [Jidongwangia harbinensis]MCA2211638.1 hypothetical protein [Jidongwangia harbinensis]